MGAAYVHGCVFFCTVFGEYVVFLGDKYKGVVLCYEFVSSYGRCAVSGST